MSQTAITKAFEQLKAQQAANGSVLVLDEFVFANVPDLDPNAAIDRNESWPAASQIVARLAVSKTGRVNDNAVVYSVAMGADVGDFEFNWIGLINKASSTVCMIVHAPAQKKIKTASGQQGNVLTRSFLMEYDGAAQQTQIITPVDTWQIDFTARLNGGDERVRRENVDLWGAAGFIGDGFLVSKSGTKYSVKNGAGYVAGLRAELMAAQDITVGTKPSKVWLDVCWRGTLTSEWQVVSKITVAETLEDYFIGDEKHWVFAIAEIAADGSVTDLRPAGNAPERNSQPASAVLNAFSALVPAGNTLPWFDGSKKLGLTQLSEIMRLLLQEGTISGAREYLGLGEGAVIPVGVPVPYFSATPPAGWIKCNGSAFSASAYPKLAQAYPSLVLPDLRGNVIRGWDDGRGIDASRVLLSEQGDATRNIIGWVVGFGGAGYEGGVFSNSGTTPFSAAAGSNGFFRKNLDISTQVPTAAENRVRNIAFNYIVRAA